MTFQFLFLGEADRKITIKMPKHIFAGKRKMNKVSRRWSRLCNKEATKKTQNHVIVVESDRSGTRNKQTCIFKQQIFSVVFLSWCYSWALVVVFPFWTTRVTFVLRFCQTEALVDSFGENRALRFFVNVSAWKNPCSLCMKRAREGERTNQIPEFLIDFKDNTTGRLL